MSALSVCGWLWVAWVVIWIIAARSVLTIKEGEGLWSYQHTIPTYLALWAIFHNTQPPLGPWISFLWQNESLAWGGAALTLAGHAFGCWGRWHLGKYWSGAVALKENHKLIDTGPYAMVRHPIYTGLFMAVIGSVLAAGTGEAVLGLLIMIPAYAVKCWREEKIMTREFGGAYTAYRQRTKYIVPYLF